MMATAAELQIKRRQTLAFIAANPYAVTLIPRVEVRTGAGGRVGSDGPPRLPQTLRLIDQSSASGNSPGALRSQDGLQRKGTHMLLGPYDASMALGDHWTSGGKQYHISELLPDNGYEKRGMVVCDG